MGKIIPRSKCSFGIITGASAGLNWGPQGLTNDESGITLGVGGAACAVRLENPGTYLLFARIHFSGNFQAGDVLNYGLMDQQAENEIGGTTQLKAPLDDGEWEQEFTRVHTINTPRTISLFVANKTANRGGVVGIRTEIKWVQIS
jgi:hypothetical protein